jgi:hypothetical protein
MDITSLLGCSRDNRLVFVLGEELHVNIHIQTLAFAFFLVSSYYGRKILIKLVLSLHTGQLDKFVLQVRQHT